ncbi:MAG: thioredoxin family protein [Fimbriimonadaceae bacterium]
MKALALIGIFAIATSAWSSPAPMTAEAMLNAAEAKAGQEHKNVLLIFHASWCSWCHKLDDLLGSTQFKRAFDKSYVIVHVTVLEDAAHKADENPGGADLLASLGGKDGGIPFFAIFNPHGAKLGDSLAPTNIGYPAEPKEVAHFMDLMRKTSHMTPAEQASLKAFLSAKS